MSTTCIIAGFFKEISLPITAIDSVGGFHNGSPVALLLKEKSEFGRTIFFLAKWRPARLAMIGRRILLAQLVHRYC